MRLRRFGNCLLVGLLLVGAAPPLLAAAFDEIEIPPAGPEEIKSKLGEVGDAEKHKADAVVVLEHKDIVVRPNGIGTAREQRVTKILKEEAIRSLAVQRFPFDPHTNRMELLAIRVYRKDGAVEEIDLSGVPKQPQTAWGIFWPTDQYLVEVPGLRVGDAVETLTEMTGFNVAYLADEGGAEELNAYGKPLEPPVPGHWHDEAHFWTNGWPILEKRYSVRIPKDKPLQYEVYNGELRVAVTFDETHLTYVFTKEDLEPLAGEHGMEAWQNVAPKLLLATLPTWVDKARWLHSVSEPQLEADEAIRQKVLEIIQGCTTDEEKYTALNHWVAENIRYAGTSRGMSEGYTIHTSIDTFRDRCGVCKDKAGMLTTMLRVAGYDAYTVMTMARQRVDPIPADQFNHCVTCIRWPDGKLLLLDPTWMPKSRDNWSTLEPDQHVVYGLPEGKELSTSPYFPPEDCTAHWQATSAIEEDNDLTGSFAFQANGAPEGRLRRTLAGMHPHDRRDFFDRTFQRLAPNAEVKGVALMDPEDFSGPLRIQCEYAAPDFVLGDGDKRYLALPMMQSVFGDRTIYDLFGHNDAKERQYGIKLLATRLGRFEETITLPGGWKVADKPADVELDGPSAALKFKCDDSTPGQLKYTCDLVVKKWTIPPEDYANFKEVIEKFEELTGRVVTCELENAHAQR